MRVRLMAMAAVLVLAGCSSDRPDETHRVEVGGTGEVDLPAELADLRLEFEAMADNASKAGERLRHKVNPLIEDLRGALPEGAELQARSLTVSPQYQWQEGERSLEGYHATRSVQLLGLPVSETGEWTARLVKEDPQTMSVNNYRLKEGNTAEQQALDRAFRNARQRARALATSADQELGQTLSIKEQQVSQPGPRAMMATAASEETRETDDFEPGSVRARADVRVTFSLE